MALLNRAKRVALEVAVLEFLAGSPQGARIEDLRARFPHSQVAHVTEGLVERGKCVRLYDGGFYGLTENGWSRIGRRPVVVTPS